jgi:hypothetical protein
MRGQPEFSVLLKMSTRPGVGGEIPGNPAQDDEFFGSLGPRS